MEASGTENFGKLHRAKDIPVPPKREVIMSEDKECPDVYINKHTVDTLKTQTNTYLEGYCHIIDEIGAIPDDNKIHYVSADKLKLAQDQLEEEKQYSAHNLSSYHIAHEQAISNGEKYQSCLAELNKVQDQLAIALSALRKISKFRDADEAEEAIEQIEGMK